MKFIEKILIAETLVGLMFMIWGLSGGQELLMLGMLLLSCLYFYLAFVLLLGIPLRGMFKKASYVNIRAVRIVGSLVAGIIFSVVLIGILFKILSLTGASEMLLLGSTQLFLVLVVAIAALIIGKKQLDYFYKQLFTRGVLILALGLFCFFTPTSSFIRFFHRNDPELGELLIKAHENPNDQRIQRELEEMLKSRR